MALAQTQHNAINEGVKYAWGIRTGTYTPADFSIDLGFTPYRVRIVNLAARIEVDMYFDPDVDATDNIGLDGGDNEKALITIANGTRTYATSPITLGADGKSFDVDISDLTTLIVTAEDARWEAWG
jgi:hypothetical protein